MDDFMKMANGNPLYLLVPVAIALLFTLYWWSNQRKKKGANVPKGSNEASPIRDKEPEEKEQIIKERPYNALIYDDVHRLRYKAQITRLAGKDYGRQWRYGSDPLFSLELTPNGQLVPTPFPATLEHSPTELYESIQTRDDMQEVFGSQEHPGDKVKMWLLIILAVVVVFLMYLKARG